MSADQFNSTKVLSNYPCAHRQWRHDGNCALVHGYSRSFEFIFGAHTLDKCGFVVDFGDLDWLKDYLTYWYDHTLLLMPDDPVLEQFKQLELAGACALRLAQYGVGMEGTAQQVGEYADATLRQRTKGRAWVRSVEARENDKNSAFWYNPQDKFQGWL